MTRKLHIKKLREHFRDRDKFNLDELHGFYEDIEGDLKRSTLYWRVYELKERGVIRRIGRGIYTLQFLNRWTPQISSNLKHYFNIVKNEYPYLEFCIWTTRWLLEFTHHMPVKYRLLMDVEKEAQRSVINFLRSQTENQRLVRDPREIEFSGYLDTETIFVRTLISQSPLMEVEGVVVPTLEKILIDLNYDKKIFQPIQGEELRTINQNIFDKYTVNTSVLKRYAMRRNKWDRFKAYVDENLVNVNL